MKDMKDVNQIKSYFCPLVLEKPEDEMELNAGSPEQSHQMEVDKIWSTQ